MTTKDLMLKVKEELEAQGFTVNSQDDYSRQAKAERDNKSEWIPVEGYDFKRYYGVDIRLEVVHRHNGTDENKSVDIAVYKYYASSGRCVSKERVNANMGDKAIKNRINKMVALFEATN